MGLQQFSGKRESSEVEGLEEWTLWKDVSLQLALMDGERRGKRRTFHLVVNNISKGRWLAFIAFFVGQ